MSKTFDVCVAGAGLTGRLMALALDHCGFSVLQVDRATPGAPVHDGRTTALAYASVRLFKRLGLWDDLEAKAEPITDIMVSNGNPRDRFRRGGLTGGQLHFPASLLGEHDPEMDEPALGYIVENADLIAAFAAAAETSNITERWGVSVESYAAPKTEGHGTVTLSDGTEEKTLLLAACDGKFSPLRSLMNMQVLQWSYPQTAIIFNIAHERPHHGVAHEVFYPDGPFAILPMRNNHSSIVWTEKTRSAKSFLAMDDDAFLAAARERIGDHLGGLSLATPRQSYPLSLLYAPKLVRERFVLAGDAAHGIHPIAGQGFNLGIKDIAALCHSLVEARDTGLDIGHGTVLGGYDKWRRFDAASMAVGTDTLNRLFSNNFGPLKHLRGLGLAAVQRVDPARRFFMRASGADLGQLPALMQPL
ncbi:UbiH/UbiF/VisC/COQ6 family ubiquinone biosynthesis hydroxylase [Parvularcula lutaonensis]|uniref:UbiH/UbiF/VisC/COQ6 family ubiquinone biosynthesis hydroxylase n=1 Tax=Parvularcula lutaonensis TaxID=491923 RepID=A0ABV7M9V5_9PROT|nr:UbiH/UbiF/VisC/COQ6 family ubiquinone biosynthesis hydroxylase [Parvularcula lutaonensis]